MMYLKDQIDDLLDSEHERLKKKRDDYANQKLYHNASHVLHKLDELGTIRHKLKSLTEIVAITGEKLQ